MKRIHDLPLFSLSLLAAMLVLPILFLKSCHQADPPDILLICADDLGWSDLGCYGSEVQTPHIDQLAREGMRFTQFHNTSKCFPSRACLLTGLYAQQSGYHDSFNHPLRNAVTLGEVLREAGYLTLWSGKHHGLENPVTRGFDRYYGLKDGACNYFNPGEQRPGEPPPARKGRPGEKRDRSWCIDSVMFEPYTPEAEDFYTTDYFTDYALGWLEEYSDDPRPLFLYLAYTAPHDPLMAWPEDIARYGGTYDEGYSAIREMRYRKQLEMGLIDSTYRLTDPTYPAWPELTDSMRREEIRKMEVYAAMIDRMDQNLGRVITKLKETGRWENTLVMFVSDNGASAEVVRLEDDFGETGTMTRWSSLGHRWANVANTPFKYYKNYSYEGGINTPLIARWPGRIEPGSFSRFPGHFIDLMPTLVEVSGADYPERYNGTEILPMEGVSLLPAFEGKPEVDNRAGPLFWEWRDGQAVRRGDWKLVRHGLDNPWELYRISEDPTEVNDLSGKYPEKAGELQNLFLEWKDRVLSP